MPDSLTRAIRWDTVVGALLLVLLLLSFSLVDGFGNALNLSFLIGNTLPIALIALPMTLLVVSGEIDLSVASTAGLSGAVMGKLWNEGMTIETIIPLCLVLGVVCGLVNGLLVTRLGLPSLAVTIGTLAAYRGIAQIVLGSDAVTDFPTQYLDFAAGRIGDSFLPQAFLPFLASCSASRWSFCTPRRSAPSLFAVGASQEEAARFAGIPGQAGEADPVHRHGVHGLAHRCLLGAALRQCPLRQRHGTRTLRRRGGVARRHRLRRRQGDARRRDRRVFLLGALQNVMSLMNVSAQSQIVVTGVLLVVSVLGPRVARRLAVARAGRQAASTPTSSLRSPS